MSRLEVIGLTGMPEIARGADLAGMILDALARQDLALETTDVLVVTQKVVSKAEGCEVSLDTIEPSALARTWSQAHGRDARVIELALREAVRIVRMDRGILITVTRHGLMCANSGVDVSNVRPGVALTLPADPDASAARLRAAIEGRTTVAPGIVISDTFGRPWREGLVNVAIGLAGVRALDDYRGERDVFGRKLQVSVLASADEMASAAELVMGKARAIPVVLLRGLEHTGSATAADLQRDPALELFR